MERKKPSQDEWVSDLVELAESAVVGYEKYLKDELNYRELARIMKQLRGHLPIGNFAGITGSDKK
mgnify:FL=1|tara:strand:- start:148 stop:342 length:195 start_codon:yes stop_codon:yes gene_type:complete